MAKLSQDKIEWILSLNATQAQEQIRKLTKENRDLEKQCEAANKVMASVAKDSEAWKTAEANLKSYKKQIAENKAMLRELDKQLDDNTRTLAQLEKELKNTQKDFKNTSKALEPERYRELQERIRQLKDAIHEAKNETEKMSSSWKGVAKLKQVVMGAFLEIGASITQNILGAFKNAFNIIVDFEAETTRLASILGLPKDGIEDLSKAARELGASTSYSAAEVTQLQIELAKLGFAKDQIMAMSPAVLKFAKAVGTDLASAAAFSGAALRIFGRDASQTEDTLATFAVATTKTALDFSKLNSSLSTVGPVAAAMGVSLEDTVALLGQLSNAGFDASSAATATRNIFLNLADSNGDLAKALGGPAKSAEDLAKGLLKLKDDGIDLAKALDLTDSASVAAFSTFIDGADKLVGLRDSISEVTGEFDKMSETANDNVSTALAGLQSASEELILNIGLATTGPLKNLVDMLTKIVTAVGDNIKWIQSLILTIAAFKAPVLIATAATKAWSAAATVAKGVAASCKAAWLGMSAAVNTLRGNIQTATTATQAMGVALKSIPWLQVAGLIASVVTAVISFGSAVKSATERTKELSAAQEAEKNAMDQCSKSVGEQIGKVKALEAVARAETASMEDRKKACEDLNSIIPEYNAHIDETTEKYEAANSALGIYVENLQKSARLKYYDDMLAAASTELEETRNFLNNAKKEAEEMIPALGKPMLEMAEHAYAEAEKKVNDIMDLMSDAAKNNLISFGDQTSTETEAERKARLKAEEAARREAARLAAQERREQERAEREQAKAAEEARKKSVKTMKQGYEDRLRIIQAGLDKEREFMQQSIIDGRTSQEAADIYMLARDREYQGERLKVLQEYLEAVKASEDLTADERRDIELKTNKDILTARRQLLTDTGNLAAKMRELSNTTDPASEKGINRTYDEQILGVQRLYAAMIETAREAGEDTVALEQAKAARIDELNEERRQKLFELAQITGVTWAEEYDNELAQLEAMHAKGIVSEEKFQKAKLKLQMDNAKKYYDYFSGLASSTVNAMQEAEISAVEAKYDVLIQQAKNNGEETAALEQQKENEKLKIQKKYADVNFAIKVSEIIANTAVAIMQAFAQLGPIGGAVAAAMLTATGAAQTAVANAERKRVKSMQPGTSASSGAESETPQTPTATRQLTGYSEGGYTGDGDRYEVAGVVHKGEYVVPKPIMSEPAVIDAVGVIEAVRYDRMRLAPTLPSRGFADGGFTSAVPDGGGRQASADSLAKAAAELRQAIQDIRELRAYVVYRDIKKTGEAIERASAPFTRNRKDSKR